MDGLEEKIIKMIGSANSLKMTSILDKLTNEAAAIGKKKILELIDQGKLKVNDDYTIEVVQK